MELLTDPNFWTALAALTFLEIVLGIDNIVFIAIAASKLPQKDRQKGRNMGLWLAMILRLVMLLGIFWITKLDSDLFTVFNHGVSVKDLVLLVGGLFLLGKGTWEIHETIDGHEHNKDEKVKATLFMVITQIVIINVVFSLDSVITAIGMTDIVVVMIAAIVISTIVMMISATPVADFIEKHPTTKMLALSFILLVGVALIADGMGVHIERGYIYFAIGFSLLVEFFNILYRRKRRAEPKLMAHKKWVSNDATKK